MNKDLTVGKPSKVLWMFCLPLFLSMLFQQLYNIADSFVAGRFISEQALGAVSNGYEITLVFIAFAFGVNIGCSVIVAKLFGEKNYKDLKTSVYTTLIASAVLCLVLVGVGQLSLEAILRAINTPNDIFDDSVLYLRIYLGGFVFVLYYYIATGIFSALGDSKTPLIFLICSSLANIGMDILFVAAFKMGVAGVAWATFICQGIACILAVIFVLLRFKKLPCEEKAPIWSWKILGNITKVAVPSVIQQLFISVSNIIIQGAVNGYGSSITAGYGAAIKLNNLVIASLVTVGNGISSYVAQNIGAKKYDRVKEGYKAGLIMVMIICIPLVALYMGAGKYLTMFFIKDADVASEAVKTGQEILFILAPFYFVIATKFISDGVLRGASCMIRFMGATIIDLVIRVALALLLNMWLGKLGIWISFPIGWIIGAVISYFFYRFNKTIHPDIIPESSENNA